PHLLVYSWELSAGTIPSGGTKPPEQAAERVTVRFEPRGAATEVVVTHERIADEAARNTHEQGWLGCLDGLVAFLAAP
ncbi:MAG: SRPBCC domain-containing protein, partial [Stellaceae bacterium]